MGVLASADCCRGGGRISEPDWPRPLRLPLLRSSAGETRPRGRRRGRRRADRLWQGARVGHRQLARRADRRGLPGRRGIRHSPPVRRTARVQPRPPLPGGGPGHGRGPSLLRFERHRLLGAGRRGADRQIRHARHIGTHGRRARHTARAACCRSGCTASNVGGRSRHDAGRPRHRIRAGQAERRQRPVRSHEPGSG